MSQNAEELLSKISPLEVRKQLFIKGDYSFIIEGKSKNGENKGEIARHEKQNKALKILCSNKYDQFLYGGAAGGAKSWTGVSWIVFMCQCYPGTRWFIARNELKDLTDSVMVTFSKVCREYGITEYKFNAVKNYIEFPNGSHINLIEVKYKPSDPMYEDVGSTEYTGGWFEEIGEINKKAVNTLQTRVGRHLNEEYGIEGVVFLTCNPKKNWAKTEFYDKHINGKLLKENEDDDKLNKYYLDCLVTENPFIEEKYIQNLRRQASEDKSMFERLFKGNWDYDDNPYQLAEQEMIDAIFDNDHVPTGLKCIIVDAARFGNDVARIGYFDGWNLHDVISLEISKTTEIELAVRTLRFRYKVSKNHVLVDDDGVGGGVTDGTGGVGFKNNGKPIKQGKDTPNYRNLQVQCLYLLAEKINEAGVNVSADLTSDEKEQIKSELAQIQSSGDTDPTRKLDCKRKGEIKQDIGRSPDWRDLLMMRVYFDLKSTKRKFMGSRKRNTI